MTILARSTCDGYIFRCLCDVLTYVYLFLEIILFFVIHAMFLLAPYDGVYTPLHAMILLICIPFRDFRLLMVYMLSRWCVMTECCISLVLLCASVVLYAYGMLSACVLLSRCFLFSGYCFRAGCSGDTVCLQHDVC
jgi:hypothetical protein